VALQIQIPVDQLGPLPVQIPEGDLCGPLCEGIRFRQLPADRDQVVAEVALLEGIDPAPAGTLRLDSVPLADDALVIKEVHRTFHEHRSRHARAGHFEGPFQDGNHVSKKTDRDSPFDVRPEERQLVDVSGAGRPERSPGADGGAIPRGCSLCT
jgi:hypothetical protein